MKKSTSIANYGYSIVLLIALVILWHMSVAFGWINDFVLPYPLDVVRTLFKIREDLADHLAATVQEALYGLLLAIAFSVVTAFVMDQFAAVKKALFPIFLVSQTIPVICLRHCLRCGSDSV